jgi:hypothetical protein
MIATQLISRETVLEAQVAKLPTAVLQKFHRLQEERDAHEAAYTAAFAAWQLAHKQLGVAQADAAVAADADRRNLHRLAQERHAGTPLPPGDRAAATAAMLAHCQEREGSRRKARDESEARLMATNQLVAACSDLIRRTADPAQLTPIVLTPGRAKTAREVDVARVRGDIAKIAAELQALDAAPVPAAEAAARLDDFLNEAARQFDPATSYFTAASYTAPSLDDLLPYKLLTLLAALPEVRAAFHARVAAAYPKLPAAVPTKDRAALRAQVVDRRRQLELAEEQIILEAEAAGYTIPRRPDADRDVVLRAVLAA